MTALLVNPNYLGVEAIIREVQEAATGKGVQLHILKAATENEIDAADFAPALLSLLTTRYSAPGATNSCPLHRATASRQSILSENLQQPEA